MDEKRPRAPMPIPAITLWQPWATWVRLGWKTIETRTHDRFASLVGQRIAIHAAARCLDPDAWEAARLAAPDRVAYVGGLFDISLSLQRAEKERGRIVCTAKVVHGTWLVSEDHAPAALCSTAGKFGLYLADRDVECAGVPAKGKQGIWYWTPPESEGD